MRRTPKNTGDASERDSSGRSRSSDRTARDASQAPDDLTLNEYFEVWSARKYATSAKKATPYRYEHWYRNHIEKPLGETKLSSLRRRDMIEFQALLAVESTPSTVNYTMTLLNIILNDAVAEELLEDNPSDRIRPLKKATPAAAATKHRALTEEEQKKFMRAAKASFYYEFFALLLLTGLRHGEAAALTWEDVDDDENVIHVTKSLTFDRAGRVVVGTPKSESSVRDIPMNENIHKVLDMQREKTRDLLGTARMARRGDRQRIFYPRPHPEGVLHNTTANQAMKRILEEMRRQGDPIEHFTLHALRDTFATRFIEQGGRPQTLKTILGHSSLDMTMDLYSHVLPNTRQMEMDRVKIRI